jgi:hypothetical protein
MDAQQHGSKGFIWAFLAAGLLSVMFACGLVAAVGQWEPELGEVFIPLTPDPSGAASTGQPAGNWALGTPEAGLETPGSLGTAAPLAVTEQPLGTEPPTAEPVVVLTEPAVTAVPDTGAGGSPGSFQGGQGGSASEGCRWEKTFEENFEGDSLDTSRWDTNFKAGDTESHHYVGDVFEVRDGVLRIRAEERQVEDRKYASGIITTEDRFEQRFGRFVVRAKAPAGNALWPAFWLMPASGDYLPEIDVFEILGQTPHTVYLTSHWRGESGDRTYQTRSFTGPDFSRDFHVFAVDWTQNEIIWLVDGIERARETRGVPHEKMFMLLNLAVGGAWPGYPDATTPFPSYLEVDFVLAYAWACPDENSD